MPLSFEKVVECISTTMNINTVITMRLKHKSYRSTSTVIMGKKRDYELSCRNFSIWIYRKVKRTQPVVQFK